MSDELVYSYQVHYRGAPAPRTPRTGIPNPGMNSLPDLKVCQGTTLTINERSGIFRYARGELPLGRYYCESA